MSGWNYPERMGKMFVINVTTLQRSVWSLIKGFLDPVTASKIHVLTGPEAKTELPKHIPIENLPKSFYGACQCEGGCELSDAGPWQEQEFKQPAWWEKDPADTTIENKPTEIETGNGAPIPDGTKVEGQSTEASVTEEAKAPA